LFLPDMVALSDKASNSNRLVAGNKFAMTRDTESPAIGNALQVLPYVLRQNQCECYRAVKRGPRGTPIQHDLLAFSYRTSLSRLRQQAERLGMLWNPNTPWNFESPAMCTSINIHNADLVPDFPSDWIMFDPQMLLRATNVRLSFGTHYYHDDCITERLGHPTMLSTSISETDEIGVTRPPPWLSHVEWDNEEHNFSWPLIDDKCPKATNACRLLFETAKLLKEGGNEAVQLAHWSEAVRRYDKAIQYCAVALMANPHESMKYLTSGHTHVVTEQEDNKSVFLARVIAVWSPLVRILVTSHLNLSMLGLKTEVHDLTSQDSVSQGRSALRILAPFACTRGKVIYEKEDVGREYVIRDDEPTSTYDETKELQAKAYFRLGVALIDVGSYKDAIDNLEASVAAMYAAAKNATQNTADTPRAMNPDDQKPINLVLRKIREAKRQYNAQKQRYRQRYMRALDEENENKNDATNAT
jgi:tetratricopeptide (TPR) repeat protein